MHTEKVIVNPILMDENRQRWRPTQPNEHRIKFQDENFRPFLTEKKKSTTLIFIAIDCHLSFSLYFYELVHTDCVLYFGCFIQPRLSQMHLINLFECSFNNFANTFISTLNWPFLHLAIKLGNITIVQCLIWIFR